VTVASCATSGLSDFLVGAGVSSLALVGGPLALSGEVERLRRC